MLFYILAQNAKMLKKTQHKKPCTVEAHSHRLTHSVTLANTVTWSHGQAETGKHRNRKTQRIQQRGQRPGYGVRVEVSLIVSSFL